MTIRPWGIKNLFNDFWSRLVTKPCCLRRNESPRSLLMKSTLEVQIRAYLTYIMQIWSIFLDLYDASFKFNWSYVPHSYERKFSNCVNEDWKKNCKGPQRGLNPCPRDALTSWAMEPQMMGIGHFWVQIMHDHESMDEMIFMKWLIYWTADMISTEPIILAAIIYCRGVEKRETSALLYAIAITAFINARIIALLDFTPALQYMIYYLSIISSLCYSKCSNLRLTETRSRLRFVLLAICIVIS